MPSIMHIMFWLANSVNVGIFFFLTLTHKGDKPYFQSFGAFELIICIITLVVRIFIISLRYGYTHVDKMALRYGNFSDNVERREYIVNGWRNVDSATLDLEIKYSIVRLQIESSFFNYNTMSHVENFAIEKLAVESSLMERIKKMKEGIFFCQKKLRRLKMIMIKINLLIILVIKVIILIWLKCSK